MSMVVGIDIATGASPTWTTSISSAVWNTVDTQSGTTAISTPTSTGTNFSFVKTFSIDITTTNSLTMTNVKVGKVAVEATTGTKLWHTLAHAVGSYVQATVAPTATGDNNSTAPTINSATGNADPTVGVAAVPLIGSAAVYAAGGFSTTGRKGNLVEVALGIDATNVSAGSAVATPTLRFSWTEG